MEQITNTILMIRPVSFSKNEETAVNNYFQSDINNSADIINKQAQFEFDTFVSKLKEIGVNVIAVDDTFKPVTPDALFPNNWISFHANGNVALYPMYAKNRRLERRSDVLDTLESQGFAISNTIDYSSAEHEDVFLEGTGSIILDRVNRKAYCALSDRADESLFIEFCEDFEFLPVIFSANQTFEGKRLPIYHTNVMMCIAETFAVICLDSIDNKKERQSIIKHLKSDGKEIITISEDQMHQFAGNMLQLKTNTGGSVLVMSQSAYESLSDSQIKAINSHCEILSSSLTTIETCGGGSARCMMAEIFLPKKE